MGSLEIGWLDEGEEAEFEPRDTDSGRGDSQPEKLRETVDYTRN